MSEGELDRSVEDQKSINTCTSRSTQFAVGTWQARLEQSDSVEVEKKAIEVFIKQELSQLLKQFYLEICMAYFQPSSRKTIQPFNMHGIFPTVFTENHSTQS